MILEEATKEAFNYYARDLKHHSDKSILAACELCGEIRILKMNIYRTFCGSCSGILNNSYKSTKNGMWNGGKIKRICPVCEKEFEVKPSRIKSSKKIYCSLKCFGKEHRGIKNCNWKEKVKCKCKQCDKKFKVNPSVIKNGNGIFCSQSCKTIYQLHQSRPEKTKPEKIFEDICIKYNLPFIFNGHGPVVINRATPDFIYTSLKIAVEIFGDYYHGQWFGFKGLRYKSTVKGRREQLKAEGYKLIVFWESDIMREDADKFVLRKLKKKGVIN